MHAITVVLVALAVAAPSGAAATAKPLIRLSDNSPVTISGIRFRAGERVTIHVTTAGMSLTRIAKAARVGTFRAIFVGLTYDPCSGLSVRASGGRGSVATLIVKPPPSCPVPPQPVDR